tara:strand:- start:362 stop:1108 length:747 start_codon:yes stop_codon:yes gene_type:complete
MEKSLKYLNNSDQKTYIKKKFKKKEVYKQVEKIIRIEKSKKKILDVGTANGELIYFLNKKFQNRFEYTGIDISSKLIQFAKKNQPKIRFFRKNINDKSFKEKFDIIILLGVSGYYNDIRKLIDKSLSILNKRGIIILEGGVNFNNFDVKIKFRENYKKIKTKWENGFNAISAYSLINYLKKKKLKFNFVSWKFKIPLKFKKKDDKIRNRTFMDHKNNFWIINGLNIVTHGPLNNHLNHNASMLIIRKN